MNTHKPKQKQRDTEQGITLIALIVTIIIMVILATITIRMLTDEDSIILSTQSATLDYDIAQYGEQVEELFQGIILDKWILGDDVILDDVAEEMEEESWIKTAEVDDEGTSIIVTVPEGYEYQVFYDEETGEKQIEYLGKDTDGKVPTVTASYDQLNVEIDAVAECDDGIALIELIYKGEVIATYEGSSNKEETSFDVDQTGWYTIRATSTKGKYKYAYVRVYTTISAPTIAVTSSGTAVNNWYGADGVALEVTISTDNSTAVGIYYKANKDEEYTYVDGTSKTLVISDVGKTIIYAYTVDKNGYESDISSLEVKYDNVPPVITLADVEVSGTEGNNEWYTSDVIISLENAVTDATSGVSGYYYYTGDDSSSKSELIGISTTMKITTEGETVVVVQAEDNAGNVSGESTINVKKDTVAPTDFKPSISNEGVSGFTITAGTSDETSGIDYYEFYVSGSKVGTSTDGTYAVTGLPTNGSYTVYVIAYDKAGNSKTSTNVIAETKGELLAPKIELSGDTGNNNYYTGDITVTIKDSADASTTGAYQIKYSVTGANEISTQTVAGTTASFIITIDGESTITAWVVDNSSNSSDTSTETVNRDATAPTISSATSTGTSSSAATIAVEATDSGGSGIASYAYYFGTTLKVTNSSTSTTDSSSVTGLTSGDSNSCTVVVTDGAGNTTEKSITVATKLYTWNVYSATATTYYTQSTSSTTLKIYTWEQWEEDAPDEPSGQASCYTYYCAKVGTSASFSNSTGCFTLGGTSTTSMLCQLDNNFLVGCYVIANGQCLASKTTCNTVYYLKSFVSLTCTVECANAKHCWFRTFNVTKYNSSSTSYYTQGTKTYDPVSSYNEGAYPNGDEQDGYWYVLQS